MSTIRPRPQISEKPGSSGQSITKFKRQVSPEGKERLSELATRRHQQGGFQKSSDGKIKTRGEGKKTKERKRVSARVAAAAREKKTAQNIIDVFKDGISPTQPMAIRLKAAEAWIKVEQEDIKLQLKEASTESERFDRSKALEILSKSLTSGHSALLLKRELAERTGIDPDVIEGRLSNDS